MTRITKEFENRTTKENRTSRYRTQKRLLNDEDEQYIETYDGIDIKKSNTDSFYIVEKGFENRLDLISFKYYNNPLFYWIIAEASGIIDPFNVPAGTVLRIPDKQSLYGIGGVVV